MSRNPSAVEIVSSTLPNRIAASWHRSLACGLQRSDQKELPYSEDALDDSPLLRAARPVLDRFGQTLSGAPASVMLADENGCILDQRIGDLQTLQQALEKSGAAPGVLFSEEFAGTNGVGTALEDASVTTVHGDQHFAEYMRHLSCVGSPIRHPITNSLRGVLDLTTLVEDYNPLMAPLVLEAVKHIETRLTQFSSAHEVALMEEFTRTATKCHGPVVGIASNVFLCNTAATGVIHPYDHTLLWELATSKATTDQFDAAVELGAGPCVVTCTPVVPSLAKERGYVLRLDYTAGSGGGRRSRGTRHAAGAFDLPGRSALWRRAIGELRQCVNDPTPVVIHGEAGLGKVTLGEQLLAAAARRGDAQTIEAGEVTSSEVLQTLQLGVGVVLRCADAPSAGELSELVTRAKTAVEADPRVGRLVVTLRSPCPAEREIQRGLTGIAWSVHLPPLRRRPEDVADIVPVVLRSLPGGSRLRCSPSAMQMLMQDQWRDNVEGIERALRHACSAARGVDLQPGDLPQWLVTESSGRALSTFERAERDLIIETLHGVGNNRTQAARILGIGRATLYRKMRSLAIPVSGRHVS